MKAVEMTQLGWLYETQFEEIINSVYACDEIASRDSSNQQENLYLKEVLLAGLEKFQLVFPQFTVFKTNKIGSLFEIQQVSIFRKDVQVLISETVFKSKDLLSEILAVVVAQLESMA